jgi:prevent-host-death family protein
MKIPISKAESRLSQLVKSVQAGEEVIISKRDEPVVRLVPIENPVARELPRGNGKRIIEWLRNHPLPEYNRRSAEEIDAAIEAERNAWD